MAIQQLIRFEVTVLQCNFNTPSLLQSAMLRFEKFMHLKAKLLPSTLLIATLDIEIIWSSLLLRPSLYKSYCNALLGSNSLIPHCLVATDAHIVSFETALKDTQELWKQYYNEEYLPPAHLFENIKSESNPFHFDDSAPKGSRYAKTPFDPTRYIQNRSMYYSACYNTENEEQWKKWLIEDANKCKEFKPQVLLP